MNNDLKPIYAILSGLIVMVVPTIFLNHYHHNITRLPTTAIGVISFGIITIAILAMSFFYLNEMSCQHCGKLLCISPHKNQ